jgi:hypothetical protein
MKRPLLVVVAPLLAGLGGCASSVAGEIDGQSVPALFSAFFVQDEQDTVDPLNGQPATLFTVSAGGLSVFDGCNQTAKRQSAFNAAFDDQTRALKAAKNADDTQAANDDFVQAIVDYDVANLPSDMWQVSLSMTAFSQADLAKGDADIDVKNPEQNPDTIGGASICRVDDWPEAKKQKDGSLVLREHTSCFNAKKGSVTVKQYTKDKTVLITAKVDFSRDDLFPDDNAGSADVTISAGWCEELEKNLDDLKKLEEDRAAPPTN